VALEVIPSESSARSDHSFMVDGAMKYLGLVSQRN